jgi:hypothetical protein
MKILVLCLMMLVSTSTYAITQEDAKQLIDFNEKSFSPKELINNQELCSFHNSLIKISKNKKELLQCNTRKDSPETQDQVLLNQLTNVTQSMALIEMVHPEVEPLSPKSIQSFAIQKMKMQGFGN